MLFQMPNSQGFKCIAHVPSSRLLEIASGVTSCCCEARPSSKTANSALCRGTADWTRGGAKRSHGHPPSCRPAKPVSAPSQAIVQPAPDSRTSSHTTKQHAKSAPLSTQPSATSGEQIIPAIDASRRSPQCQNAVFSPTIFRRVPMERSCVFLFGSHASSVPITNMLLPGFPALLFSLALRHACQSTRFEQSSAIKLFRDPVSDCHRRSSRGCCGKGMFKSSPQTHAHEAPKHCEWNKADACVTFSAGICTGSRLV